MKILAAALLSLTAAVAAASGYPRQYIRAGDDPALAFKAALDKVRRAGGGVIEFEKGEYFFDAGKAARMSFFISNHDQSDVHSVHLPVSGVTNLTVVGNGSRFVFSGATIAMALVDTENVTVSGIRFDWDKPFLFEARITGFEDGVTRVDRMPDFKVARCMLYRAGTHEVVERTGTVKWESDYSRLGAEAGDIVVMRPDRRPCPAVVVYRAKDTLFEDTVVHTACGMAWIVQRSENFTLRGSLTAEDRTAGVYPSPGRIVSTHADATHFSNVKGMVRVENCWFEAMMDDAINVHSTCLRITEVIGKNRIRCRYMHFQAVGFETFLPGETLRFIRGRTLENGPECKVKGVERVDEREIVISLEGTVPCGFGAGDAVENADYQPSVVFNANRVTRNRARGALFTTPKPVVCANNVFDRVSGSAVLLAGDAQGWYESGACSDVLITNNVFRNCLTSRHCFGFAEGVISVYPSVMDISEQKRRYHRGIRIVGNVFESFDVPLLFALSADDLEFSRNRVVRNAAYRQWGEGDFIIRHCGRVSLQKDLAIRTEHPFRRHGLAAMYWVQPEPVDLPELLVTGSGSKIRTREEWESKRRPEIKKKFTEMVYGKRPVEKPRNLRFRDVLAPAPAMNGKAVKREIEISFAGPRGEGSFRALAFIPVSRKPVPAFLLVCNRPALENLDPSRARKTEFFPAEELVDRSFAAVAFHAPAVAPDEYNGFTNGVYALFSDPQERKDDDWGMLSAWAWGASRVMDWIETVAGIDAGRVAVIGHSRGGKASLWAGAADERFILTCVNGSGCGGARLNHLSIPCAETIGLIAAVRPHWMCAAWGKWSGREMQTPFDQHELMALVAPRFLAVGSATKDYGAGPFGEYSSAKYASPAWELYGVRGLVSKHFPQGGEHQGKGRVSYHLREGRHDLNLEDWRYYMDYFGTAMEYLELEKK